MTYLIAALVGMLFAPLLLGVFLHLGRIIGSPVMKLFRSATKDDTW